MKYWKFAIPIIILISVMVFLIFIKSFDPYKCRHPQLVAFRLNALPEKNEPNTLGNEQVTVEQTSGVPLDYFWGEVDERSGVLEESYTLKPTLTVQAIRLEIEPGWGCFSGDSFIPKNKTFTVNGKKYDGVYRDLIKRDEGIEEILLKLSWRNKFQTEYKVSIKW